MAVGRECPSGAIQYRRKDGGREEQPPPVSLISAREAGPYALRGPLSIDAKPIGHRATLCRCGASKTKPFCDGSHKEIGFDASGEPPTGDATEMLAVRDGPVEVTLQLDGPLMVRGNLEIISGTRTCDRPPGRRAPVPLRAFQYQTVLRRHAYERGLPIQLNLVGQQAQCSNVASIARSYRRCRGGDRSLMAGPTSGSTN